MAEQLTYGIRPGYIANCSENHAHNHFSNGRLRMEGGSWYSALYDSMPREERMKVPIDEIGAFTRSQAQEECEIHRKDFPGHPCKTKRVGYEWGGMG